MNETRLKNYICLVCGKGCACTKSFRDAIEKAVLAERKRCAKIVECFMPKKEHWSNEGVTHFLEIIAKAITNNDNE